MQQHYFIGIQIPSTFEQQVEQFKQKYQLDTAYKVIPHTEDLHVTLLYLGTIPENLLPILKKELVAIALRHPAFSIEVVGLSYFGASSGPRVVYLAVQESIALAELQKEIEQMIANQLERPMSERFIPHVTIAKKRKTSDALVIQKESIQPIEVAVQSFAFFAVHPDKTPKYEVIETFEMD